MSSNLEFGFLSTLPTPLEGAFGRIALHPRFAEQLESLRLELDDEGWAYPPVMASYPTFFDRETGRRRAAPQPIPNTTRPAHLYRPLPSHILEYRGQGAESAQREMPGLLLQALAFFTGTRLQFCDWRMDLRTHIDKPRPPFVCWESEVQPLLEYAYRAAADFTPKDLRLLTNLLAIHNRVPAYEWVWEQFLWQYTVLDAVAALRGLRKKRHGERVQILCESLSIPDDVQRRVRIVELRTQLVHEATWDGRPHGSSGEQDAYDAQNFLRQLVERLIMHVLKIPCGFRVSMWTSYSQHGLDLFDDREAHG